MRIHRHISHQVATAALGLLSLAGLYCPALAQTTIVGPGILPGTDAFVSDQKPGSILFYTYYESSSTNTSVNTRINLTNTNPQQTAFVHVFFIASCSPADAYLCLTPSQTMSVTTADFDPDAKGYIVAVAVEGGTPTAPGSGCPISFNWLIGNEYIKLAGGFTATLGAEAVAARFNGSLAGCATGDLSATLNLDGATYDRIGGVLSADNIPSRLDGNQIRLIVIGPHGDLSTSGGETGMLFGALYDESEQPHSFRLGGDCLVNILLDNKSVRILNGGFDAVIGLGRSGWIRFWSLDGHALLGALLITNSTPSNNSFTGGHTLHKLTMANTSLTIPLFTPVC